MGCHRCKVRGFASAIPSAAHGTRTWPRRQWPAARTARRGVQPGDELLGPRLIVGDGRPRDDLAIRRHRADDVSPETGVNTDVQHAIHGISPPFAEECIGNGISPTRRRLRRNLAYKPSSPPAVCDRPVPRVSTGGAASRALTVTKRRRRLTDFRSRQSGRRNAVLNRPDLLRASPTKPDLASLIIPNADCCWPRGRPQDKASG